MGQSKVKNITKKQNSFITKDLLKLFGSLVLFILFLLPNYIWAGIQCLTQKPRDIRGKVVLITGAAGGLGRQLALSFHRLGARIVCVDVNGAGNDLTGEMIRAEGGTAVTYTVDITDRENVRQMHGVVKDALGSVDVLINNAAVVLSNIYVNRESDDLVKDIVNVNLLAQFWMNKEILPSMLERNSGQIVAISSVASLIGHHSLTAYSASKWGVTGMMEALDQELKLLGSDIVVTTVCPYFFDSDVSKSVTKNSLSKLSLNATCDSIVDGILKNKKIFTVPSKMYLLVILFRILPSKSQYSIFKILGSSFRYKKSDYETLKKYQRKELVVTAVNDL